MPLATRLFFRYLYPAETLPAGAEQSG